MGKALAFFFVGIFGIKNKQRGGEAAARPRRPEEKNHQGGNSMKRVFVKAVLMLLVLALPAVACGQTVRQTVTENGRIRETLVTFAEAPQAIRDLMNGHGLGDARCVCGAALEPGSRWPGARISPACRGRAAH